MTKNERLIDRMALEAAIEESDGSISHAKCIETAIATYLRVADEDIRRQAKRAKAKRLAKDRNAV